MRLIFCRVSGDSSSDSLLLPPVDLRVLGGRGDLAELGLERRGRGGEAFSSTERRWRARGESWDTAGDMVVWAGGEEARLVATWMGWRAPLAGSPELGCRTVLTGSTELG
jgi:hypothetical protein